METAVTATVAPAVETGGALADDALPWAAIRPGIDDYLCALGIRDARLRADVLQRVHAKLQPLPSQPAAHLLELALRTLNRQINLWLQESIAQYGDEAAMPIQAVRAEILAHANPGWVPAFLAGIPIRPDPGAAVLHPRPPPAALAMPVQTLRSAGERLRFALLRLSLRPRSRNG